MSVAIISASLRNDNNSYRIAQQYSSILNHMNIEHNIVDLKQLPHDVLNAMATSDFSCSPEFEAFFNKNMINSSHFIWILPEYNGSFPASAKLLVDAGDVKNGFYNKPNLLVGVATGRAGNLRGMDHFTGVLHHLQGKVHWDKLPISQVHTLFSDNNEFDQATYNRMEIQFTDFIQRNPLSE